MMKDKKEDNSDMDIPNERSDKDKNYTKSRVKRMIIKRSFGINGMGRTKILFLT